MSRCSQTAAILSYSPITLDRGRPARSQNLSAPTGTAPQPPCPLSGSRQIPPAKNNQERQTKRTSVTKEASHLGRSSAYLAHCVSWSWALQQEDTQMTSDGISNYQINVRVVTGRCSNRNEQSGRHIHSSGDKWSVPPFQHCAKSLQLISSPSPPDHPPGWARLAPSYRWRRLTEVDLSETT